MAVFYNLNDMKAFFQRLERAAKGDFREQLEKWIQALGASFLEIVEQQIIEQKSMDTRLLLNSFHQGAGDGVWALSDGGLTLEVGTNVEYAKWVNDGHTQQPGRFIPGHWSGDRFTYVPGAKTGMVLKEKWVPGSHYWDRAFRIFEIMFPVEAEAKLQQWLDDYFSQ